MDPARALAGLRQVRLHREWSSAAGPPSPISKTARSWHRPRVSRTGRMPHDAVSTSSVGARSGTLIRIGPRPRIWCSAGTGLFSQGSAVRPASATRLRRCPSGSSKWSVGRPSALATSPLATPSCAEALAPPAERVGAGDPQSRPGDRVRSALLAGDGPVEEGDVRAGRCDAIGVEEMIGARHRPGSPSS